MEDSKLLWHIMWFIYITDYVNYFSRNQLKMLNFCNVAWQVADFCFLSIEVWTLLALNNIVNVFFFVVGIDICYCSNQNFESTSSGQKWKWRGGKTKSAIWDLTILLCFDICSPVKALWLVNTSLLKKIWISSRNWILLVGGLDHALLDNI